VGNAASWQIVGVLTGLVVALSSLFAMATVATESDDAKAADYEYAAGDDRALRIFLATTRAVLGVGADGFPREPGNSYHELLATVAAFVGATVPALIIGILAVRIFAIPLLVWRSKLNLLTAVELRSDTSPSIGRGADGVLAIRFYKRMRGVTLSDVRVRAYLGYRTTSLIDGTTFFKRDLLKVLSADADEVEERIWPQVETAMPLTLWIPLHAPAPDQKLVSVQGHELQEKNYLIFVTVQARVAGLNVEMTDHARYYLRRDLQVGRPVAIEPSIDGTRKGAERSERSWRGWDRFDEASTYGIFIYGSMASADEIGAILGYPAVEGVDFMPAVLPGWRRTWNVCTDNTTSTKVRYYTPGTDERPPVQVLFLNIERAADEHVTGYVMVVQAEHLLTLDAREGNYDRTLVSGEITVEGTAAPGVIWTYVGKKNRTATARAAIMRGTGRIRQEYLAKLLAAFDGRDGLLAELQDTLTPPPAPTVSLDRRTD
jgi:hypothetical protein